MLSKKLILQIYEIGNEPDVFLIEELRSDYFALQHRKNALLLKISQLKTEIDTKNYQGDYFKAELEGLEEKIASIEKEQEGISNRLIIDLDSDLFPEDVAAIEEEEEEEILI